MTGAANFIRRDVPPSGTGCVDCDANGTWWLHLRRCAFCGYVGCCDESPNQHASKHAAHTGHRVIQSFEPGENWFWDFGTDQYFDGPPLAPPRSHPRAQFVPGPAERVPGNWEELLNE